MEMSMLNYILKGHMPVPCPDLVEWAQWMQTSDRHVAKTEINGVTVSTIFLAIDHGLHGVPIFFETMVFGGALDQEQERYGTWEEAERGHAATVERVRASEKWPEEI